MPLFAAPRIDIAAATFRPDDSREVEECDHTEGWTWGGALTAVVAGAAVDEILRLGGHGCEGALLMGARLGAGVVVSLDLLECRRMLFLRLRPDRLAGERSCRPPP